MPPNQQNPYDFITNSPQKKRSLFGGGNSQKTRIIQVAIFAIGIIALIVIFFAVLGNVNKGNMNSLLELAASQQDIMAITKDGSTKIRDGNLAIQNATASAVIASHNSGTLQLIAASGNKKPSKQIAALQVTTYTKSLDDGVKNGNYDAVFTALLANRIDEYRGKLQAAYVGAKDTKTKKQLSDYYQQLEAFNQKASSTQ